MLSTRYIPKSRTQRMLSALLFLLVSVVLAFTLPVARALAADTGSTLLGILVVDSSKGQGGSGNDATKLSILVTNSAIYTITLSSNGGDGPNSTIDVAYGKVPDKVPKPERTGYTFLGYFDKPTGGTQYYDQEGVGVHIWDKNSDATLYAHWALKIKCSFPTSALIQVNALGEVTGQKNLEFSSTSAGAIKVTAVESSQDSGADSLFVGVATLHGTRILLTPPAASGSTVQVPLTTATTTIPGEGWTIAAGTIDNPSTLLVDFSLFLPDGAQLNYLAGDGEVSVANLSYVVSTA
ncbi:MULTISPECIES: InlB B-repeat-containing protein [Gordonibacter]|uniref:InlB B-repeat-containing protein n=1 Tax=Gordonibacter faecis TaxID=3047475 RepID=A0ABT7DUD1_9ACTN|nr:MULTISPECIES: InlB B-repeat-containing protein [unclassified Gordonibacter]MDJ1651710.1 InlB B-repeat-containing protein [Gordonibacter sp. KGMB12511]HIW77133.1 InlB B-repeat-containing protein [Candidatus Gordonibacter avicola]